MKKFWKWLAGAVGAVAGGIAAGLAGASIIGAFGFILAYTLTELNR